MIIRPQAGPQTAFLESPADILIYGGEAGGAKTFSLLMEGMRNITIKGSQSAIFRRESTDLRDGGMWDESMPLFQALGCKSNNSFLRHDYPDGGFLKFSGMQHEKDMYSEQGKQYGFIGFDEVTHFSEKMFFYMLSRNRSVVVNPYMRGTCNPDPDSFLVNGREGWGSGFISWWIGEDGLAIPERDGQLRYMYRSGDDIDWDTEKEALLERHYEPLKERFMRMNDGGKIITWAKYCEEAVNSVSFIKSSVYDNKELLKKDPSYLTKLAGLDEIERQRLMEGNWRAKHEGSIFKRDMFKYYDSIPYLTNVMIFADTAQSTRDTAAFTVYMLLGINPQGIFVLDVLRKRLDADDLLTEAVNFWNKHKRPVQSNNPPAVFRIENKSSGIGLNQQLRKRNVPIDPIERGKNKASDKFEKAASSKWERATNAVYALNGRPIYLPKVPTEYSPSISWVGPLLSECLAAEKQGDKKGFWDQIDTLSDGITEFYLINNDMWVM